MRAFLIAAIANPFCPIRQAQTVSPLFARGYTVIPESQQVSLGAKDFIFDQSWHLKLDKSVPSNDIAVEALREDLIVRFNVTLDAPHRSGGILSLRIHPGSVPTGNALDSNKESLEDQVYRIDLHSSLVTIIANAPTGLFYRVETLIQLSWSKLWPRILRYAEST